MVTEIPFVPPHESIEEELAASSVTLECTWHSSIPLAIYVDRTPFSKLDSILGIFVVILVTGSRHLVGTLRKTDICKCGCKGFVAEFIKWSCLTAWRARRRAFLACRNTTGVHRHSPSYHKGLGRIRLDIPVLRLPL